LAPGSRSCDAGAFGGQLAFNEACDTLDRIEIRRHELVVLDRDAVLAFEEANQLEDASRVDDPAVEERLTVVEILILPKQKVFDDELTDFRFPRGHG